MFPSSQTDLMLTFAETRDYSTQTLLAYFGEELKRRCGHCDNCVEGTAEEPVPESAELFPVHSQVRHAYGEATLDIIIYCPPEQQPAGRLVVAPGPADLLEVAVR